MEYRFFLVDRDNVKTEISEPIGWTDVTENLLRQDYHGFNQYQEIDTLEFDGIAVSILKREYDHFGTDGRVDFEVDINCGFDWQPYFRGRVDFMEYLYRCSDCRVRVPFTAMGDDIIVTTRNEQKVNLESLESFDGVELDPYEGLGLVIEMPSKSIVLTSESKNDIQDNVLIAAVDDNNKYTGMAGWLEALKSNSNTGLAQGFIQPNFGIVGFQEIEAFTPPTYVDYVQSSLLTTGSVYQMIRYVGEIDLTDVQFNLILKGRIVDRSNPPGARTASYQLVFIRKPSTGSNVDFLAPINIPRTSVSNTYDFYDFDINISENIYINRGDELYVAIYLSYLKIATTSFYELWYEQEEAFVKFYTQSQTPPTNAKQFLVNEALSRTVEAYSNDEVRVLSDFLGRTDSQPYAREVDGCGSLESITNGLFLRRIEEAKPDTPPIFTVSFLDLFKGLSNIFNLGWGFENDPFRPGKRIVRVEERGYFYQNDVILELDHIDEVEIEVDGGKIYGEVNIGYQKWEAEEYNGLDEFLTKRTYRTTLKTNTKEFAKLEFLSNLIASGYAIEITRRKGNQDTSDWRYDNETFIICLKRDEENNLVVEQGGIENPSNIIDPPTILNYRISPVRNLLRFVKDIFMCYKTINSESKLIFTEGEGNFYAAGKYDGDCSLENMVLVENQDVDKNVFVDENDALPIAYNEIVSFTYPLSFDQITTIRNNPYGLIKWSTEKCQGYGWIKQIERNASTGKSDIKLINSRRRPYSYRVDGIQSRMSFIHFEPKSVLNNDEGISFTQFQHVNFNTDCVVVGNITKEDFVNEISSNIWIDTPNQFINEIFSLFGNGFILDFEQDEFEPYIFDIRLQLQIEYSGDSENAVNRILDFLNPVSLNNLNNKSILLGPSTSNIEIQLYQNMGLNTFSDKIKFEVLINGNWVDMTDKVDHSNNKYYGICEWESFEVITDYRLVHPDGVTILKTGSVEII